MNEIPTFIKINDLRIKLKNIKTYGIDTGDVYFEKIYDRVLVTKNKKSLFRKASSIVETKYVYNGESIEIDKIRYDNMENGFVYLRFINLLKGEKADTFEIDVVNGEANTGRKIKSEKVLITATNDGMYSCNVRATRDDLIVKQEEYLYVTTFQNLIHKFYNDDKAALKDKLSELDKIFCK